MSFPLLIPFFGQSLHPHPVMEVIGYTGGSQLYFYLCRRARKQAQVPIEPNLWLLVGCIFGALFGAKILAAAESWADVHDAISAGNWVALIGGKTIVGGLLGGWAGVEIAKRCLGVRQSTGDLFVFPLIFGIAAGRVGCFLTGLADHTHGIETSLPWGVDFGDGVRRHPTQLYEIAYLVLLAIALAFLKWPGSAVRSTERWVDHPGRLFRCFLGSYLVFRFAVEFIKPSDKAIIGLSAIQWASLIGAAVCGLQLRGRDRARIES